jgi:hypothetical protein
MKTLLASLLLLPAVAFAQQPAQQPPQPPAEPQGAAKPALKLRLNEIDDRQRRAIVGFQPSDADSRKDAGADLPGLGRKSGARDWSRQNPNDIVPYTDPNQPY